MRQFLIGALAALVGLTGVVGAVSPAAAQNEIVIGVQCDRTGATQIVGTVLCPAMHDYFALVNSKGGVEGRKIKALEIDHEYKVPPAVESYERHKKEGAVSDGRLRHAPDLRACREADGRQDPRHLAGLRQRRRRRRHPVSVHLPDRGHLLVAGHRGSRLRQEAARRQLEGQEDRVPVLRQSGGPGAHRGARGSGGSARASSSRCSPCRLRAWRWAPRSSTSPSASARTS